MCAHFMQARDHLQQSARMSMLFDVGQHLARWPVCSKRIDRRAGAAHSGWRPNSRQSAECLSHGSANILEQAHQYSMCDSMSAHMIQNRHAASGELNRMSGVLHMFNITGAIEFHAVSRSRRIPTKGIRQISGNHGPHKRYVENVQTESLRVCRRDTKSPYHGSAS